MASPGDGGGKEEVKTHFATREGPYKLMPLSEYSRPNRVTHNGQGSTPVRLSFIDIDDPSGTGDRICFNYGRELYFYPYKGVRKVRSIKMIQICFIEVILIANISCYFCHDGKILK